ncbi:hypothetical protein CC85DRAFT_283602 [Cutaneotrichosporon oleaginosum]|uniref:Mediator complex subunit 8 n=1 Tax=Cutaneotrichosporon oleaginosum TaxID=879819 RepID=A0A0J0XTD5_9TREE|nr:uncharacterized protein CC85DRAFT_283602 [Cutaneotrichosporon oleaginosum]KLT44358.1 hypothetical protein CC85DRAFT_283602 [Cutaneotrichosporon oleaginosum]TXT07917.1 hypothetical protein COLE_04841 [Cutaneotrichosporon oleaginosum]
MQGQQKLVPFVPPAPVGIPIAAVQSLVPQLATTINDIDTLKTQLSAGNVNATFPSWDTLLQRYTLLLSRVQSLSKFISTPPPKGTEPALAHYLVHPLRPLAPDADQLAQDVLFQAINTQTLPMPESESVPGARGMLGLDTLRGLDEGALQRHTDRLKARLGRESQRARGMMREIERRGEEYDWTYRPGEEEEEEKEEEEEEEDLFGDDEEEEEQKAEPLAPNPREGWGVADYLVFLETGKAKAPEAAPAEGASAAPVSAPGATAAQATALATASA